MKYESATPQTIFDTAVADGMPEYLATLMVAQSRHETGNYTSKFFKDYHNCFGYSKVLGAKWQLHIGTPNADNAKPIAAYSKIENSVHELTDWIYRRQREKKFPKDLNTIKSPLEYVTLLKNCGYFGDTLSNYLFGVVHFVGNLK